MSASSYAMWARKPSRRPLQPQPRPRLRQAAVPAQRAAPLFAKRVALAGPAGAGGPVSAADQEEASCMSCSAAQPALLRGWLANLHRPRSPAGLAECLRCHRYRQKHKGQPRPEAVWARDKGRQARQGGKVPAQRQGGRGCVASAAGMALTRRCARATRCQTSSSCRHASRRPRPEGLHPPSPQPLPGPHQLAPGAARQPAAAAVSPSATRLPCAAACAQARRPPEP